MREGKKRTTAFFVVLAAFFAAVLLGTMGLPVRAATETEPGYLFEDWEEYEVGARPEYAWADKGPLPDSGILYAFAKENGSKQNPKTGVAIDPSPSQSKGKVMQIGGGFNTAKADAGCLVSQKQTTPTLFNSGFTIAMDCYIANSLTTTADYIMLTATPGNGSGTWRPFKIVSKDNATKIVAQDKVQDGVFSETEVPIGKWFQIRLISEKSTHFSIVLAYENETGTFVETIVADEVKIQATGIASQGILVSQIYGMLETGVTENSGKIPATYYFDNLSFFPKATVPTATISEITGTGEVGATLTGNYTFSDESGFAESGSLMQWYVSDTADGIYEAIEGATSNTFTPQAAQLHKYVIFEVVPRNQYGIYGAPVRSQPKEITGDWLVAFDANAGEGADVTGIPEAKEVSNGGIVVEPGDPSRKGYAFTGWYTDKDCTQKYDFSNEVTTNLTLYAGWEVCEYTITFDGNAEDAENIPEKVAVGKGFSVTEPSSPNRPGHIFRGWYIDADCTTVYDFDSECHADATLYAKWEVNTYTVTFISTLGHVLDPVKVLHGSSVTAPNLSDVEGYRFDGWYTDVDMTDKWDFADGVTGNMELYGKFSEIKTETPGADAPEEKPNPDDEKGGGCNKNQASAAGGILFLAMGMLGWKKFGSR